MVKKAYRYRFYPTPEQADLLTRTFGCVRSVYNSILRWRTDAYYNEKQKINYLKASAKLTEIKHSGEFPWLNEVSTVPLQQSLRHQQTAFANFFAGRAKYPNFKSKHARQAAEFTRSAFRYKNGQVFLAKCSEPLNVRWSRKLPSAPSTITVSRDPTGRWFVSMLCEFEPKLLPVNDAVVGVDVGIKGLVIEDNGTVSSNPKFTSKYATKLAKYQKRLAKKKLGSKNRLKAKRKVARVHAKIADSRRDNLHKLTRRIVNENQVICIESLRVKNMMRNPKLAKSIADASWGELVRQLQYKAQWAGRTVVAIDQFFPSSKRCSKCCHIKESLPLDVRDWKCPECGTHHDRDINAAMNIKAAGLAVLALGENVNLLSSKDGISCSL